MTLHYAYTVYLSWYMASAAEDANLVEAVEVWLGLKDISDECVASEGAVSHADLASQH